jgi:hypothetical protein
MTAVSVDVKDLAEILYESGADTERAQDDVGFALGLVRRPREDLRRGAPEPRRAAGLFLWGRERSREDDAENAIRAALGDEGPDPGRGRKVLGAVVGAHRGESPALLRPASRPDRFSWSAIPEWAYNASGAPITLAGRLEDTAPGGVIVAHDTFSWLRGRRSRYISGSPSRSRAQGTDRVYLVTAVGRARSGFGAHRHRGRRDQDDRARDRAAPLQEALTLTLEDGETQVVTVVGEAGVGKSATPLRVQQLDRSSWSRRSGSSRRAPRSPPCSSLFARPRSLLVPVPASSTPTPYRSCTEIRRRCVRSSWERAPSGKAQLLIGQLVGFDFHEQARGGSGSDGRRCVPPRGAGVHGRALHQRVSR